MANKEASRGGGAIGNQEPPRAERNRMKGRYGRESVGRPDETGIRAGGQGEINRQLDTETDQGPPSRQTRMAQDMSGQM